MTRSYGDGSVFFDQKKDRWIGIFVVGHTMDGRRIRRRVHGRTKTEARSRLREIQTEFTKTQVAADGSMRVGPYLDKWLIEIIEPRAESINTFDGYESIVRNHLKPSLGKKRLRDLSPDDVDGLLRAKRASGLSHSTVARIRTALVKALRHAERFGYVNRNVAQLVDLPRAPRRQGRSLDVTQAKALLVAARGERLEAAVHCGLLLGLRPGEVLGLCWSDVDLDAGLLSVTRSLKRERNQLRLGEPKTPGSKRTLAIPIDVLDALRRHRTRQRREQLMAGEMWVEIDLIFATEIGTPTDPSNLRRDLHRLCESAGIGSWSPNELRHSFASLLSHSGVSLERIADAMGHVDTRTTSSVYRHRLSESVSDAVAPMEQLFGSR